MTVTSRHMAVDASGATLDDFTSGDALMQACLDRARLAARIDLPVLILGESGTGKTILARAIHNSSTRAQRPFVSFNAAALSDTLLDSQLFGHERGAFTGAHQRVKGKFELADGGTLFLDEIGDLSPPGQSKILRAIEHGEFERLGSEALRRADVRVLSATLHPIDVLTSTGRFREDLFFRINGLTILVPPLRDRPRDLPALIASEIGRASRHQGKPIVGLDRAAADRMLSYRWPGNLRELSKVVHAAVALTSGDVIAEEALLLPARIEMVVNVASAPATIERAPAQAAQEASRRLRDVIHAHVRFVLADVHGNKRRAARELGVARATLERKLREMDGAAQRRGPRS
jgi:two-component system, NtrC family, response regulator HydG